MDDCIRIYNLKPLFCLKNSVTVDFTRTQYHRWFRIIFPSLPPLDIFGQSEFHDHLVEFFRWWFPQREQAWPALSCTLMGILHGAIFPKCISISANCWTTPFQTAWPQNIDRFIMDFSSLLCCWKLLEVLEGWTFVSKELHQHRYFPTLQPKSGREDAIWLVFRFFQGKFKTP